MQSCRGEMMILCPQRNPGKYQHVSGCAGECEQQSCSVVHLWQKLLYSAVMLMFMAPFRVHLRMFV